MKFYCTSDPFQLRACYTKILTALCLLNPIQRTLWNRLDTSGFYRPSPDSRGQEPNAPGQEQQGWVTLLLGDGTYATAPHKSSSNPREAPRQEQLGILYPLQTNY